MSASFSAEDEEAGQDPEVCASARSRRYSQADLARHDGSDPALPVLVAYKGRVYDVTASYPWAKGLHWAEHRAGQDLTGCLNETVHGEEMLSRVPCVGILGEELR
jgi:predicted heme/steroid binding protein